MTIAIRRANVGDLETLLPLVQRYRVFYKQKPDAQRERAFIQERLERGTSIIFLACIDERAVGFAQLFDLASGVNLGIEYVLGDLFVEPNARRNGVATKLLARAVDHARRSSATGLFLETAIDNATAQAVYERSGWRRESRFLKYNATL
ncbi:MAG: GNAT family N-acetyltransferase [Candidatus Eremiobacteraeota bacterium]|nr:GNAT family N-acetyltransferase [Candidatus Eremiobacteraeota bacterium]